MSVNVTLFILYCFGVSLLKSFLDYNGQRCYFLPHLHVNNLEMLEQPFGVSMLTFANHHSRPFLGHQSRFAL